MTTRLKPIRCAAALMCLSLSLPVMAQESAAELKERIRVLEAQLEESKRALAKAEQQSKVTETASTEPDTDMAFDLAGGRLKVGGAVRVNYTAGTYPKDTGGGKAAVPSPMGAMSDWTPHVLIWITRTATCWASLNTGFTTGMVDLERATTCCTPPGWATTTPMAARCKWV